MLPRKLKFENSPLPIELMYKNVLNDKENKGELIHLKINIKTIWLSSFGSYNKKDKPFDNLPKEENDKPIKALV